MALFRLKKSKNTNTLPEVEQYYSAERRERSGLAWILAVVSILIVALIIVGLFFGGRWIYRTVTKDDTQPVVTTSDNGSGSTSVDGGSSSSNSGSSSNNSGSTSGDSSSTGSTSGNSSGSSSSTGSTSGSSSTGSSTGNSSSTSGSTSSTGAATSTTGSGLPNTGPGDTAAIFIGATAIATSAHYLYQKRKSVRQ